MDLYICIVNKKYECEKTKQNKTKNRKRNRKRNTHTHNLINGVRSITANSINNNEKVGRANLNGNDCVYVALCERDSCAPTLVLSPPPDRCATYPLWMCKFPLLCASKLFAMIFFFAELFLLLALFESFGVSRCVRVCISCFFLCLCKIVLFWSQFSSAEFRRVQLNFLCSPLNSTLFLASF